MAANRPPMALWEVDGPVEPLRGGGRNAVLRAGAVVFKSTTRSAAALAWLEPVLDAAEAAGFVVPRLIPDRTGAPSAEGWTCEPWIAGRPLGEAEMPGLHDRVAAFHAAAEGIGQRPGFRAARDLRDAQAGGDVDLGAMPEDLVARCRAAWAMLAPGDRGAIHGDLHPGNALRLVDGRIALLDWDEARVDARAFDLGQVGGTIPEAAHLAWEIACSWHVEPGYARALVPRLVRAGRARG